MLETKEARHYIMQHVAKATKRVSPENLELAIRVIMDHLRAVVMLLAEGVIPEGTGRGHVLRRLIRRASLFGWKVSDQYFEYKYTRSDSMNLFWRDSYPAF